MFSKLDFESDIEILIIEPMYFSSPRNQVKNKYGSDQTIVSSIDINKYVKS